MARVLVLDDEPLIALLLRDWLEELGHETIGPANTVQSALELIGNEPVEAALLDLSVGGDTS